MAMATDVPDVEEEDAQPPLPLTSDGSDSQGRAGSSDALPLINTVVLTGLKGAGKTCNLVRFGMMALASWKRPVFSDFPFGGDLFGQHYECEPLPDDALINYCRDLPAYPVIILDEIQEFFDRQDWMSTKSKQGISLAQQIRKLGILIIGACQFFHYLNPRLNDQVDILVRCEDLSFKDYGIREDLRRGRVSILQWFDLSGALTGRSARNEGNYHYVSGEPYIEELVFTEPYWEFFDTRRLTALEQRFMKYVLEKKVMKIPTTDDEKPRSESDELIKTIVDIYDSREDKTKGILATPFKRMLEADGFRLNTRDLSATLRRLGFSDRGTHHGTEYFKPGTLVEAGP